MRTYPALKTIINILYAFAVLSGIITIILAFQTTELANILRLPDNYGFLIFLLIAGGFVILFFVARAEMIKVNLDLDETVNDQLELQQETNRLLQELVNGMPIKSEAANALEDQSKALVEELSKIIDKGILSKLSSAKLHKINQFFSTMGNDEIIVLRDNQVKLITQERLDTIKYQGLSDQYLVVYKKHI